MSCNNENIIPDGMLSAPWFFIHDVSFAAKLDTQLQLWVSFVQEKKIRKKVREIKSHLLFSQLFPRNS